MAKYLGVDTSNYTTSVCIYDAQEHAFYQQAKVLEVRLGERGLRQSDALFQHTVNLPVLMRALQEQGVCQDIAAVGVSTRPRRVEGSYMPCFLAGVSAATSAAAALNVPCREFSHQEGHIMAVLSGLEAEERQQLLSGPFLALHLSGGTTELLFTQREGEAFHVEVVGGSRDISVGQLIDRTGVMLGMKFPCGRELDALSLEGSYAPRLRLACSEGWFHLSGYENQVKQLIEKQTPPQDVARFALKAVTVNLGKMLDTLPEQYANLPLVVMGGVASNTLVRRSLSARQDHRAYFSTGERSRDNAMGIAYLASL